MTTPNPTPSEEMMTKAMLILRKHNGYCYIQTAFNLDDDEIKDLCTCQVRDSALSLAQSYEKGRMEERERVLKILKKKKKGLRELNLPSSNFLADGLDIAIEAITPEPTEAGE